MFRTFFFAFVLSCLRLSACEEAQVCIFSSSELAAKHAARRIADLIVSNQETGTVLGLATGSTMEPVYAALKKIIVKESIDLTNVTTFNLDEYLGIPSSDPQSYRSFTYSHLFEGAPLFPAKSLRHQGREHPSPLR